MSKVVFAIKYEVLEEKLDEYLDVMRELKNIVKAEGMESYRVFKVKSKKNYYQEIYLFENQEAFDNFDDDPDERVDLLIPNFNACKIFNLPICPRIRRMLFH